MIVSIYDCLRLYLIEKYKAKGRSSSCLEVVEPFLDNGVVPLDELRAMLNEIRTKIVNDEIAALGNNHVLLAKRPRINLPEQTFALQSNDPGKNST